jgi:hypothetical protein
MVKYIKLKKNILTFLGRQQAGGGSLGRLVGATRRAGE